VKPWKPDWRANTAIASRTSIRPIFAQPAAR
jgi:hypothetical protein